MSTAYQPLFFKSIKISKHICHFMTYSFLDALVRFFKFKSCNAFPNTPSFASDKISSSRWSAYSNPEINADRHCRCAFLDAWNLKRRTGCTFRHLSDTQIPAEPSQPDLLTHNLHFLLQLSWQFGVHRTFCHSSTYRIICKSSTFYLFYEWLYIKKLFRK